MPKPGELDYTDLDPRIYLEVGGTVNLGVNVGAAKATIGLEVDVPEGMDVNDFRQALSDDLFEMLDAQMTSTIRYIKG